jgi:hypothetical protein
MTTCSHSKSVVFNHSFELKDADRVLREEIDEIRGLLSISPDADDQDALRIMKWWRETGAGEASVPVDWPASAIRRGTSL